MEIAHFQKFFLKGLVKSLIVGIIFRCFRSVIVLLNAKFLASTFEIFFKFRTIIMANSWYLTIKKKKEPEKEILTIFRGLGFIDSSKSEFAKFINSGKNISFGDQGVGTPSIEIKRD